MGRTLFVFVLLAAVAHGPLHAIGAEPSGRVARIGYVDPDKRANALWGWPAFWKRMHELGWVEGQNLIVEARWAEGQSEHLPHLMAEVVGRKVDVLFTYHTTGALAAKNTTSTVPVVFAGVPDPVGTGLVTSLARPGGNLTGLSSASEEGWMGKWLELLQEAVPHLTTVAIVANPDDPYLQPRARQLEAAASVRGMKLRFFHVRQAEELDVTFEQARRQAQAVLIMTDPFTMANRRQILALAYKHRLPDMYGLRENVEMGGLMSYGVDARPTWRRAAEYVDKILRGAKPEDLPVERADQFVLAINLKRAKALGLTMPDSILLRAGEIVR